jgi:DNA-binding GntR family transcriptional regulator
MIALYDSPARRVCSFDERNESLDALASGDREKASRCMAEHLHVCEDKLTKRETREPVNIEKLIAGIGKAS